MTHNPFSLAIMTRKLSMKTDGIQKLSNLLMITNSANKAQTKTSSHLGKDEFAQKHSLEFSKRFSDRRLREQDVVVNVSSQSTSSSSIPWWSLEQENLLPTVAVLRIKPSQINESLLRRLKEIAGDKSYLQINLFDVLSM
jgi:hypothetical protein